MIFTMHTLIIVLFFALFIGSLVYFLERRDYIEYYLILRIYIVVALVFFFPIGIDLGVFTALFKEGNYWSVWIYLFSYTAVVDVIGFILFKVIERLENGEIENNGETILTILYAIKRTDADKVYFDFEKETDTSYIRPACLLPTRELAEEYIKNKLSTKYKAVRIEVDKGDVGVLSWSQEATTE